MMVGRPIANAGRPGPAAPTWTPRRNCSPLHGVATRRTWTTSSRATRRPCRARRDTLRRPGPRCWPARAEALAALSARPGVVQTVVTGNIRPVAEIKLGALGPDAGIDFEVGGYGTDDGVRATLVRRSRGAGTREVRRLRRGSGRRRHPAGRRGRAGQRGHRGRGGHRRARARPSSRRPAPTTCSTRWPTPTRWCGCSPAEARVVARGGGRVASPA